MPAKGSDFMWPFRKKVNPLGFRRDESGALAFDLTPEEQREVDQTMKAFEGYVVNPQYAEEVRCSIIARGLSNYAVSCVLGDQMEEAFAAVTKAYSIFPVPIYLYDGACFLEKMGRAREAADLYRKFLASESAFEATPIQKALLQDRDIFEAVKDARRKVQW